ncbi:MAG TPA: response regulator [Campylobacterales bacterium]|nr:response regulator [Campylobacterales bacterium]
MYLHDELIVLGLIFIDAIVIFYLYRYIKDQYKTRIEELQKEIHLLNNKSLPVKESGFSNTKKSFVLEQIEKIEVLEKELAKQKKRVDDIKIIAKEATDTKAKFLLNMKTELRTPLNKIMMNAGVLKNEFQNTQHAYYIQNIFNASNHLLTLINKILEFTNIQNKNFKVEEQAVDVVALISGIVETEKANAQKKGLQLSVQVDKNIPHSLILDALKVKEIVTNLIENGIKFTQEGYVKVMIQTDETNILKNSVNLSVVVEDSGIGIEPKEQKKIFEAFGNDSIGLGLSINRQVAKLMHGDITFKNNTPKGSIFTFYLPNIEIALKDDTVTCKDEKQIDFSLISPNGAKIIVIDSDNNTQKTLQRCFADTAVKVYTFANAKEAIEKLKEHSFDMILIDIDTLCAEQSAISKVIAKVSDAPVITLVNTRLKDKDLDAVKAKVLGHLKKPICEAELFKISLKSIRKL